MSQNETEDDEPYIPFEDYEEDVYDYWVDNSITDFEAEFIELLKKWYKGNSWYGGRLDRIYESLDARIKYLKEEDLK